MQVVTHILMATITVVTLIAIYSIVLAVGRKRRK